MLNFLSFLKYALLRSPDKIAGLLFIVATLLISASWCIVLFFDTPPDMSPAESAIHSLEEMFAQGNPSRLWFVWFAFLPLACTVLGLAYLLDLARARTGAMVLFVLSVGLAATAFLFTQWALALCVALPCYWGFRCAYRV
jgi:hypothetical protein